MISSWDYIKPEYEEAISHFLCDNEPEVAQFLKEEALKLHSLNTVKTRLYFDANQSVVGFFSLFNDLVQIYKNQKKKHNWGFPDRLTFLPALRLHYIGIDQRYQRRGLGTELMFEVFGIAKEISELSGCNFISVEVLNSSIEFYEKFEYKQVRKDVEFRNMVLKIDEIK